jgi:DNA-binding NtrC family response regulator
VLTGHASEQVGVEAVNRGASSFLLKPANVVILNALINDYAQTVQFLRMSQTNQRSLKAITNDKALTLQEAIEKTEVQLLSNSLKRNRNNVSTVCEELGIPRTTLWRKLKAYNLEQKVE